MVSQKFDDKTCFEVIRSFAEKNLSKKRYEHSFRVAQTAAIMCRLYGLSEDEGLIAGIAHDICKEIPEDEMKNLALQDGNPLSEIETRKPSLLHGRAAAVKIQSEFGIHNRDVVEAVANHTFGALGCGNLAKVIFAADKIEPGRPQSTDEYRHNLFSKSLDELVVSVLEENFDYLAAHGKKVAPSSIEWCSSLKANLQNLQEKK